MAEQQTLKRRGLIAGAAALVAGIAAKQASTPVVAANDSFYAAHATSAGATTPGFIAYNDGANYYQFGGNMYGSVAGIYGSTTTGYGVWGEAAGNGVGVYADSSSGIAVSGTSGSGVAILGTSSGNAPAVKGINTSGNNAIGVQGNTGAVGIAVLGGTKGATPTANGIGVRGLIDNGYGVSGEAGAGRGVNASSDSGYGVYASAGGNYAAVYATNTATGDGVYGTTADAASAGVRGTATNDYAVAVKADAPRYGFGVYASGGSYGISGTGTSIGVQGTSTNGYGVYGTSTNGIGVYGTTSAAGQYGVLGRTLANNSFGLTGIANGSGCAAFAGATTNAASYAAYFQGHVQIEGAFDVIGAGNKHAVVPHPDGSYRTIYSIESPECWVEDFGEGTLTGGKAEVKLDADFATLVHTDQYHVFVTPHVEQHLHVAQRTASGFVVEASAALAKAAGVSGAGSGTFSWRVVARPKTDAKVERLAKATLAPKIDFAKLPQSPPPPPVAATPPKKP